MRRAANHSMDDIARLYGHNHEMADHENLEACWGYSVMNLTCASVEYM